MCQCCPKALISLNIYAISIYSSQLTLKTVKISTRLSTSVFIVTFFNDLTVGS